MRQLKVGDRVRVYGVSKNFELVSGTGTVDGIGSDGIPLFAEGHTLAPSNGKGGFLYDLTCPHPKQCRILKARKQRHIWINEAPVYDAHILFPTGSVNADISALKHSDKDIEFVEVIRKKS